MMVLSWCLSPWTKPVRTGNAGKKTRVVRPRTVRALESAVEELRATIADLRQRLDGNVTASTSCTPPLPMPSPPSGSPPARQPFCVQSSPDCALARGGDGGSGDRVMSRPRVTLLRDDGPPEWVGTLRSSATVSCCSRRVPARARRSRLGPPRPGWRSHDDAGKALDRAVQSEGHKRDRSGKDARNHTDRPFDPQPNERQRRENLSKTREPQPRGAAGGDADLCNHCSRIRVSRLICE